MPLNDPDRSVLPVLGVPIDVLTSQEAVQRIAVWAQRKESRCVCICNAHSVITAQGDPDFMRTLCTADMATPDGAPVAWMLRRLGARRQARVSGPDLMWDYCAHAADSGEGIFLYGSSAETLQELQLNLRARWPSLRIVGAISPPFRPLRPDEDEADVKIINADSNIIGNAPLATDAQTNLEEVGGYTLDILLQGKHSLLLRQYLS